MRFGIFRMLLLIITLSVAAPAWAQAHPGLHVNPHPDPLILAVSIAVLLAAAAFILVMHLYLLRRQDRRDRFLRRRIKGYTAHEIQFTPEEFIGLTEAEAHHLHFEKDRAYLRRST